MWEQAQFWVSVVSATAAMIAALAAVGFLRKEKIVKGELYVTQQERDDLKKRLAKADARLMFIDPERFLDQADDLASSGKYAELDELATRFTDRQSEAFGRAAEVLTEQRILDSETEPSAIEDAQRFASIGLAAAPQNERLIDLQKLAQTRAKDIAQGDPIEALNWEGMSDVELIRLAISLHRAGHFVLAEVAAKRSVPLALLRTGEKSENYVSALGQHANCLLSLGQYISAEALSREALRINRDTVGVEHPKYANSLGRYASLLHLMNRHDEAELLYLQALEIQRKTIGDEHPDLAVTLNNFASLLQMTDRYEEAIQCYREALEINRNTLGDQHREYAAGLNNIAGILRIAGRSDDAEKLYREVLDIDSQTIGTEHPDHATHLNNFAEFLGSMGRLREAEEIYQNALRILEKALGQEHPNTITARENFNRLLANKPD